MSQVSTDGNATSVKNGLQTVERCVTMHPGVPSISKDQTNTLKWIMKED